MAQSCAPLLQIPISVCNFCLIQVTELLATLAVAGDLLSIKDQVASWGSSCSVM